MQLSKICLTSYRVEGPDAAKKAAAYDVEIEVDDPKKEAMRDFMMSPQSQSVSSLHIKYFMYVYYVDHQGTLYYYSITYCSLIGFFSS